MKLNILMSQRFRYLFVGLWNTIFGYAVGNFLYYVLLEQYHIILISSFGNIVAISMSFITYKLFVFKTEGNWLKEYLRSYLVYGLSAIIGVIFVWIFVNGFKLEYWIAQGIIIILTIVVSYLGHKHYTYRVG